jgi:hypothetical protein
MLIIAPTWISENARLMGGFDAAIAAAENPLAMTSPVIPTAGSDALRIGSP